MVYVALSRVQSLDQLYILEELPVEKMKPWMDAIDEMKRLDSLDELRRTSNYNFKVVSMNTSSLQAHYEDILADTHLLDSNLICIQETWTMPEETPHRFPIPGKTMHLNSVRRGAGIATYYPSDFTLLKDITAMTYQMTAITSEDKDMTVINLYRSSNANNDTVIRALNSIIAQENKSLLICADWNFCHRDEQNHKIYKFLIENKFSPSQNPPEATHRDGRCLDMIWTRMNEHLELMNYTRFAYYTDHGQQYLTF